MILIMNLILHRSVGLTIIQIVVAVALGAILFYAISKSFSTFQKATARAEKKAIVDDQLGFFLNTIEKRWKERLTPRAGDVVADSYDTTASTGFAAASNCQDLTIRRRNTRTAPESIENITYKTTCGSTFVSPINVLDDTLCANSRSQVRVQVVRVPDNIILSTQTFPENPTIESIALCTIENGAPPTGLSVVAGVLYNVAGEIRRETKTVILAIKELSDGIELLPPR